MGLRLLPEPSQAMVIQVMERKWTLSPRHPPASLREKGGQTEGVDEEKDDANGESRGNVRGTKAVAVDPSACERSCT